MKKESKWFTYYLRPGDVVKLNGIPCEITEPVKIKTKTRMMYLELR